MQDYNNLGTNPLMCLCAVSVKEKSDAKPRQHTIDLSQMAVPIPVTVERRQSPEPSGQSAGDTDAVTEYIPIGNINTSLCSVTECGFNSGAGAGS